MLSPVEVKALERYRIWLRYSDGVSGKIDLSDVAGKGVFKACDMPGFFERVYIDEYGAIVWNEDIDLCPHSLYMELTGKSWEELPLEPDAENVELNA